MAIAFEVRIEFEIQIDNDNDSVLSETRKINSIELPPHISGYSSKNTLSNEGIFTLFYDN